MWRKRDPFDAMVLDAEHVLDTTRELMADCEGVSLPNSSFLLPGAVLSVFGELSEGDDDAFDPMAIVAQHLGITTGLEGNSYGLICEISESDVGLMELARRLGRDVR